jgi:quercetin dioxygenase-like cupin family protein
MKSHVLRIAAAGVLLALSTASAQDPAVVNAETIRVRLDNDKVRVLEGTLPPGAKEQMHSHPGYVVYVIAGGKIRNHLPDGKTSETELKAGDVLYRDPLTHWGENVGTTTAKFILVELKGATR